MLSFASSRDDASQRIFKGVTGTILFSNPRLDEKKGKRLLGSLWEVLFIDLLYLVIGISLLFRFQCHLLE